MQRERSRPYPNLTPSIGPTSLTVTVLPYLRVYFRSQPVTIRRTSAGESSRNDFRKKPSRSQPTPEATAAPTARNFMTSRRPESTGPDPHPPDLLQGFSGVIASSHWGGRVGGVV